VDPAQTVGEISTQHKRPVLGYDLTKYACHVTAAQSLDNNSIRVIGLPRPGPGHLRPARRRPPPHQDRAADRQPAAAGHVPDLERRHARHHTVCGAPMSPAERSHHICSGCCNNAAAIFDVACARGCAARPAWQLAAVGVIDITDFARPVTASAWWHIAGPGREPRRDGTAGPPRGVD